MRLKKDQLTSRARNCKTRECTFFMGHASRGEFLKAYIRIPALHSIILHRKGDMGSRAK